MARNKKPEDNKLTRRKLDSQVKAFLENGGKVVKIPRGKSGFSYNKPDK